MMSLHRVQSTIYHADIACSMQSTQYSIHARGASETAWSLLRGVSRSHPALYSLTYRLYTLDTVSVTVHGDGDSHLKW